MPVQCVDCRKTHPARAVISASPFQSIIVQEMLPTPSETAAIRDYARNTDAEIARREQDIDRLLCEVTELRRSSEYHKAAIAPIRRVPPEVIAEIFMQLTGIERKKARRSASFDDSEDIFDKAYVVRPRLHAAPMIFGEICRHWRDIALSLPHLWNRIAIQCENANIPLCDLWLKRSGSLPLSIRLYREYTSPDRYITNETVRYCQELIKTILPYSNRWFFLDMENLPDRCFHVMDGLLPNSVPILEHLSVNHRDDGSTNTGVAPWTGMSGAIKLTRLQFDYIGRANIMTRVEGPMFPWAQLTHIDVGDCSTNDCLQILAQASSATTCVLRITGGPSSLEPTHITQHQIQTLKIRTTANLHSLWRSLTCSSLSTLSIQIDRTYPDLSGSQGFADFLTRSGGTIKDFTLRGSGLDDMQFITCLGSIPLLRRLDIADYRTGAPFTDQVWDALTHTSVTGEVSLVPNLESIVIEGCVGFGHKSVVRVLESRVRPTSSSPGRFPLKNLTLLIWRKMSNSAYDKLVEFTERGLAIDIDVYGGDDDDYSTGSEASDAEDEDGEDSDEGESGSDD
ncbi:hypothetical protein DFH09DRAFT_1120347 [Mycena vulgaris]|nr:hypothetical protein DFH09DRAFT_1120347 [Mycena vulgaris]